MRNTLLFLILCLSGASLTAIPGIIEAYRENGAVMSYFGVLGAHWFNWIFWMGLIILADKNK